MKFLPVALLVTTLLCVAAGCARKQEYFFGAYTHTTSGQRTSTIWINSDGTARAEFNTDWGIANRSGRYSIEKDQLKISWERTSFENLLGSRPTLPATQTMQIFKDKDGDWTIDNESTYYWMESK